ncbi:hypothetical protein BCR36DRAFT_137574 [Piromyces finnis]|uniref:alpha-galactosidase n=1 Tax=Piromyces finnis TaxID=1754191 RepID=A0A1Y1VL51_9FUNG|nr:hypothetical protein BCR36DRAFT_137574 [Piromyces finnis]|eukprot:ORX57836.1 hypothetical protein BCR36DRAFT_137574 [Piromyces finnis]
MNLLISICVIASFLSNYVRAVSWTTPGTTYNNVIADQHFDVTIEKAEVIEVDYQTSADKISLYHSYGKKVVCYFSGGTIEKWRSDYNKYAAIPGLIKNEYGNWPGEYWLDFRVSGIRDLVLARMREAKNNGCDALDVDNLDVYNSREIKSWSNPITAADTVTFARWLSEKAHSFGLLIGLKNIAGLLPELSDYYDFAINESCVNYVNECGLYRDFIKSGKAVFGLTYGNFEEKLPIMCKELNGIGISMSFKETQNLVQAGFLFDGEKYCGSNFSNGYVRSSSSVTTKKPTTTTTKKSTTSYWTSKKTTTTTTKKSTTSYWTSKKTTTTKKSTTSYWTSKKTTTTTKKPTSITTKKSTVQWTSKKTTSTKKPTTRHTTKRIVTTVRKVTSTKKHKITSTSRRITKTVNGKKVIIVIKTIFRRGKKKNN